MTLSLCTNCGKFKIGAWCDCPECASEPFDADVSLLLTDHYLTEEELERVSKAVVIIHDTGLDEDTRFQLLLYFIWRKFPKLLTFNLEDFDKPKQELLDRLYSERLARLPGQDTTQLQQPLVGRESWTQAVAEEFQEAEDNWQLAVNANLSNSLHVAREVVELHQLAGEFGLGPRLRHFLSALRGRVDYDPILSRLSQLLQDAHAVQREVDRFCGLVENGWSDRTKEQAAYFRGVSQRLIEMVERCQAVVEHKAGRNRLIPLDLKRSREEFRMSHKTFCDLVEVVRHPHWIMRDGTIRRG